MTSLHVNTLIKISNTGKLLFKKKKNPSALPYLKISCYSNTTKFFFCLSISQVCCQYIKWVKLSSDFHQDSVVMSHENQAFSYMCNLSSAWTLAHKTLRYLCRIQQNKWSFMLHHHSNLSGRVYTGIIVPGTNHNREKDTSDSHIKWLHQNKTHEYLWLIHEYLQG